MCWPGGADQVSGVGAPRPAVQLLLPAWVPTWFGGRAGQATHSRAPPELFSPEMYLQQQQRDFRPAVPDVLVLPGRLFAGLVLSGEGAALHPWTEGRLPFFLGDSQRSAGAVPAQAAASGRLIDDN